MVVWKLIQSANGRLFEYWTIIYLFTTIQDPKIFLYWEMGEQD
jgi:hypothetical protein